MDNMILYGSLALGASMWFRWYYAASHSATSWFSSGVARWLVLFLPLLFFNHLVCPQWVGSFGRAQRSFYLGEYFFMGIAWVALAEGLFQFMGVNFAGDVFERRNRAASVALSGALIGVATNIL